MSGFLVVLEGIDGSGKSTLAAGLADALEGEGRRVVRTREPTDGPYGRRIREIARGGRDLLKPEDELALFHADREAHVRDVVRPALAGGAVVVQDRSYFSTVAYQGEQGLDRDRILTESRAIAPTPDLLLVLDVPVEIALARINADRVQGADDFERADVLRRIRQVFVGLRDAVVLDGRMGPDALLREALAVVHRTIGGA